METGCLLHCLEVEETNVFEAVKQSVTTRQAALVYGISVGRNGMACCPFHDDRHPSMKVDRRFHCFACQADGDVIDFTSRLFGLSSKEAALGTPFAEGGTAFLRRTFLRFFFLSVSLSFACPYRII